MDKNLEEKLRTKFPELFRDLYGDPKETCMSWGIECGKGWYHILEMLCGAIQLIRRRADGDLYFSQIKEKFGGLRVYMNRYDESVEQMIEAAEHASFRTCEYCGSMTNCVTTEGSWLKTLCKDCRGQNVQA